MTEAGTESVKGTAWLNMAQWPCFVGYCESQEDFNASLERMGIKQEIDFITKNTGATTHEFTKDGKLCFIVCMPPYKRGKHTREGYAALLAHECQHVTLRIDKHFSDGLEFGEENYCYLLQYLLQEMLQLAWRSNKSRAVLPPSSDFRA